MPEDDLDQPATRRDLFEAQAATRRDIIELRRHFDVIAESWKSDFKNLFDWAQATTATIGTRLDSVEDDHGSRLTSLEMRVTRIEQRDEP